MFPIHSIHWPNKFWVWSFLAFSTLISTHFLHFIDASDLLLFFGKQSPAYWTCVNSGLQTPKQRIYFVWVAHSYVKPCKLYLLSLIRSAATPVPVYWMFGCRFICLGIKSWAFSESACFSSIFYNSKFILQHLWPSTGLAYLICYAFHISMFMLQTCVTADWWFISHWYCYTCSKNYLSFWVFKR